jgi:NAD(P) transhydrogenase
MSPQHEGIQPLTNETGSISGLASQATARTGNLLGILGVSTGILASLAAVGFSPEVLAQLGGIAAVGGLVGSYPPMLSSPSPCQGASANKYRLSGALIGRRITPTDLPQTVAALHSVVGLAAVLTSIGSVLAHVSDISTLHMVTAYLGVLIGQLLVSVGRAIACS